MKHPKPGEILFCDSGPASTAEHRPPEAYKRRQVVVISKRRYNSKMAAVIALSTLAPQGDLNKKRTYFIQGGKYTSLPKDCGAKGELIESVSLDRLSYPHRRSVERLDDTDMDGLRLLVRRVFSLQLSVDSQ